VNGIIHTFALKPCPWCYKTPKFIMYYGWSGKLESTFLPHVYCDNLNCTVQPKAKHVPIRKNQRFCLPTLGDKIQRALHNWNNNLNTLAFEGVNLCFEDILGEIIKIENGNSR